MQGTVDRQQSARELKYNGQQMVQLNSKLPLLNLGSWHFLSYRRWPKAVTIRVNLKTLNKVQIQWHSTNTVIE